MSDRKNTPFTNEHFIAFCERMLGQPYWYGTCVYKTSSSLLTRKAAQYPQHYGSGRTSRYKKDIAAKKVSADCVGACKGYAWTGGGVGVVESIGTDKTFASKYGSNGCPDRSANGMFSYAKSKGMEWGKIGTLPEIVGLALHKDGHIGYYAGNGYAIEWKGFNYGCVKTKVAGRGWSYWYKLPFIQYGAVSETPDMPDTPDAPTVPANPETTVRDLYYKNGRTMLRGEDVRTLQTDLNALGFNCGSADGIFGPKSAAAVMAFQKKHKLEVDGIVGSKTRAAMELALESVGKESGEAETPADKPDEGKETTGGTETPVTPDKDAPDSDEGDTEEDDQTDYTVPDEPDKLDYGTRTLCYHEGHISLTGKDVAAVQTRLSQLGFDCGKADGIYGSGTADTVKAFQKAAGIEADGVVGDDTRKALSEWKATDESVTIRIKMTREENIAVYGAEEINLDIEEYLRGVVPSEMYESANIEVLKAQAICARSYAYYRRNSVLSDTTNHQSFHAGKIGKNPRSDEAITATKGQVLTYDGKLVNCFYCASNKGVTKRSGDVWSTHYPYYVTKTDEWDEAARKERNVTSFGHGIGLSQHGAMWAAKNGVSCASILAFYYEGAVVTDHYNA